MSHIVRGRVKVAMTNKELLIKSLEGIGNVTTRDRLYRFGVGPTDRVYDIVLSDFDNSLYRIGFSQENGIWHLYQESMQGTWANTITTLIQDRYLAFHYEKELVAEGFNVTLNQHKDGMIEIEAEEMVW